MNSANYFLKGVKKNCEKFFSEVIVYILKVLPSDLFVTVECCKIFHVPFQGWLWTHVEVPQPKKRFYILPYERKQIFALYKSNKHRQTKPQTQMCAQKLHWPQCAVLEILRITHIQEFFSCRFHQLWKVPHSGFTILSITDFPMEFVAFLFYVLLHLFEADTLAFIASFQIVAVLEYNFLFAHTCALLDPLSLRY